MAPTISGNLHRWRILLFMLASLVASCQCTKRPVSLANQSENLATILEIVDWEAPARSPESSWKLLAERTLRNAANCCGCVRGQDLNIQYSFLRHRTFSTKCRCWHSNLRVPCSNSSPIIRRIEKNPWRVNLYRLRNSSSDNTSKGVDLSRNTRGTLLSITSSTSSTLK